MGGSIDGVADYKLLTVQEVAQYLRCGEDLVYTLIHSGELGAIRPGKGKFLVPAFRLRELIRTRSAPLL